MAAMNRTARWSLRAAALMLLVVPAACDTLRDPLNVDPASRIPAGLLESPENALLLSVGAIGDFECAWNSYTAYSGLIGEEFMYAQQTASRTPYDRRNTTKDDADYATNGCGTGVYTPLQTARQSNENLLALLKTWTDAQVAAGGGSPNRMDLIATAAAYAGYSYVLLGEGFCTMAVSRVNLDKTITYGGEIQPDSVFRLAVARFDEAVQAISPATTASDTSILYMAYLGRARAKLGLRDYVGAKADAQLIRPGFSRMVSASDATGRRQNRIAVENSAVNRSFSVGEPYRALNDPRVPVTATTIVSATGVTHFYQTKYATTATPLPLATYDEAQLIIAEAEIESGGAAGLIAARPILEASRTRGNQGAFTGATQADFRAELISQRRRELFAEGHHLGDIRRLGIVLTPAEGQPYHFGGTYGPDNTGTEDVCLPLPSAERLNNPLIGG